MKAQTIEWLTKLSGQLGDRFYASAAPNEPGWVIIRQKPGPHNRPGTRKDRRWKMPPKQAAAVEEMMSLQQRASAEYKDPVKRAAWQAEYEAWASSEKRNKRAGNKLNGKLVRYLWDYVRIKIKEQAGEQGH